MTKQKYAFSVEKACRSYKATDLEGKERELWTLTVRGSQLPRGMKYGPNARYADLSARPAREMLETLESEPESFVLKNNGIMVVADAIRVAGDGVEIWCNEPEPDDDSPGHGVLNGGHTYRVLEHAFDSAGGRFDGLADRVTVLMTVAIGIPEDEIWRISRARNTSEKVPLHALRELAGDWSVLKKYLPIDVRPLVAVKPNDTEAPDAEYDMTDLVRRIALVNNELFPAQDGVHPTQAYTSIGTLVKKFRQEKFLNVARLLPDVLRLEQFVVMHWEKLNGRGQGKIAITQASGCSAEHQTLLTGYRAKLTLAAPFVLPIIAAFRVFIQNGDWVEPLDDLWHTYGPKTVIALWEAYKEHGKGAAAFGRARSSWAAACDLTKSAAIQKGLIKVV